MLNKYPASLKTIRSVVNRTADKNNTMKAEKEKFGCLKLSEKDVQVKSLDGKIEYSEKQRSRLWGKTSQKLSE